VVEVFPIFGEAAAAVEPSDCSLDDPALGKNDKAPGAIAPSDDFVIRPGIASARPS
jgi:hypothetical protein